MKRIPIEEQSIQSTFLDILELLLSKDFSEQAVQGKHAQTKTRNDLLALQQQLKAFDINTASRDEKADLADAINIKILSNLTLKEHSSLTVGNITAIAQQFIQTLKEAFYI